MKRTILILMLSAALSAQAQFTEFYCNSTGTNVNAGSTTNAAATFSDANGNWDATTGIFICSGVKDLSVVAVGDWASVYIDGATVGVFVGRVTAVVDSTDTITVSLIAKSGTAPATSATGRSIKVGGAWYGPYGLAAYNEIFPFGFFQNMMTNTSHRPACVNIKGDRDYNITSNLVHSLIGYVRWQGYTNTPHDGGMAHLHGATNTAVMFYAPFLFSGAGHEFYDLWFSGGGTNATGSIHTNMFTHSAVCKLVRCLFTDSWENALRSTASGSFVAFCTVSNGNMNAASGMAGFSTTASMMYLNCIAKNGRKTVPADGHNGFTCTGNNTTPVYYINCESHNNFGSGWDITGSSANVTLINCTVSSNQLYGISGAVSVNSTTNLSQINLINCNFAQNTPFAVRGISGQASDYFWGPTIWNAGVWNNLNNFTNTNPSHIEGTVTYSVSPWVDQPAGNFTLNTTANGGALAINAGRATFIHSPTVSYPDIGSAQVTNSASGSVTVVAYPLSFRR